MKNHLKNTLDKCNKFNKNISSNRNIRRSNNSSRNNSNRSSSNSSSEDDWIIIENKNKTTDVFDNPEPKLLPTYKEIKTYLNNKCPYMKNHEIQHKLKWIFPRNEIFSSGR